MNSFYIKTFGCQMNERDSEIIAQSLTQANYLETLDIDSADLIILNTCSIRAKAEQKVMSMLGYLRKNKLKNKNLKICVAGCVAQQEGEKIIKKMPHVSLVIGTQHIYKIADFLQHSDITRRVVTSLDEKYSIPRFIPDVTSSDEEHSRNFLGGANNYSRFVTIMQGCNNYCTYCVVPYTRGREVSRKVADITDEVKVLIDSGVKEITLLGQNVNSYGKTNAVKSDGTPCSFAELLREVAQIDGLKRLRFTTSNPKDLSIELMQCFQDIDVLCPQFHLPVQSGSNAILKRMNRKYTVEKYFELVETLRSYNSDINLTTDVIVGFPGETEHDFLQTMDLLERVRFAGSFSFKYSDRPGTQSAKLDGKVPEEEKSRRLHVFQARQNELSLENNKRYVGQILEVLVEAMSRNGKCQCRAATNHVVHVETRGRVIQPGDFISVEITHAGQHSLQGMILSKESDSN